MDSLYPLSTVSATVQRYMGDERNDGQVAPLVGALLHHHHFRPDLVPVFAQLCATSRIKMKLSAYHLALRNRDENQLFMIFNQAMKVHQNQHTRTIKY